MGREEAVMSAFRVEDVMRPGGRTVAPDLSLSKLITEFLASRVNERYVVSEGGEYVGFVSLHDIKEVLKDESVLEDLVVAGDVAHRDVPEVPPRATLSECMEQFVVSGHDRLPVVSTASGHFLGTISEHDVIGLYNREILRKDFLGTLDIRQGDEKKRSLIQIPMDYAVVPVALPTAWVGKTLREANLRALYHLTVVSIQDPDKPGRDEVPNPERPLEAGVHLVVVGHGKDIERFLAETGSHRAEMSEGGGA
jgi:CBS domain-containing protein